VAAAPARRAGRQTRRPAGWQTWRPVVPRAGETAGPARLAGRPRPAARRHRVEPARRPGQGTRLRHGAGRGVVRRRPGRGPRVGFSRACRGVGGRGVLRSGRVSRLSWRLAPGVPDGARAGRRPGAWMVPGLRASRGRVPLVEVGLRKPAALAVHRLVGWCRVAVEVAARASTAVPLQGGRWIPRAVAGPRWVVVPHGLPGSASRRDRHRERGQRRGRGGRRPAAGAAGASVQGAMAGSRPGTGGVSPDPGLPLGSGVLGWLHQAGGRSWGAGSRVRGHDRLERGSGPTGGPDRLVAGPCPRRRCPCRAAGQPGDLRDRCPGSYSGKCPPPRGFFAKAAGRSPRPCWQSRRVFGLSVVLVDRGSTRSPDPHRLYAEGGRVEGRVE
jgi:hypothetical protein